MAIRARSNTSRSTIPFNEPTLVGREIDLVTEAIRNGQIGASGPQSLNAAELLRESVGSQRVLLTTSCTDALEMAALMLGLGPNDAVVLPSFTFVSTALAFARQGVKLLFADIEDETLGIDPSSVEHLLDGDVRVVIPVHYAGVACDLEGLQQVLVGRGIDIIEDNAQGLFGRYKGRPLGSFGRFSATSFHETKNLVCGEGGAFFVNREEDVDRAHVLYDKGTNRQAFMLGLVDKYSWTDIGSSFGMSDILAAYLVAQLEERATIMTRRRAIFERYDALLEPHAASLGYRTPIVPPDRHQTFHMYYVLLRDNATRNRVLSQLREHGIQATFHYVPLHDAPGAQKHLLRPTQCPVTDDISGRLLRLPFFNNLTQEEVAYVAETFLRVVAG
jgi:dTDP-4-amino-4,6-dideoxygalactose transaminase